MRNTILTMMVVAITATSAMAGQSSKHSEAGMNADRLDESTCAVFPTQPGCDHDGTWQQKVDDALNPEKHRDSAAATDISKAALPIAKVAGSDSVSHKIDHWFKKHFHF